MKHIFKTATLTLALSISLFSGMSGASTLTLSEAALSKLKNVGLSVEHIEPSPVNNIFTVVSREGISYVTSDGEYIFTGSLFHVNGNDVENTTERAVLMGIRSFASKTKSIEYKSPNEKYKLAVFTDITCGFCQKLHHDIKSYLDAGITIQYLAYPRAGLNSVVTENMAKVWCSATPTKALDEAMRVPSTVPSGRASEACLETIKSQLQIASTIPLRGTPAMISLTGEPLVFNGWVSADNLVNQMSSVKK